MAGAISTTSAALTAKRLELCTNVFPICVACAIEVDDHEIRIRGPNEALARGVAGPLPHPGAMVPSFVRKWRARRDSNSRPSAPEKPAPALKRRR